MKRVMKAVVLTKPAKGEDVVLSDIAVPEVKPGWVLVKVKAFGMNLRSDDTFVEDEGWHRAAKRYVDFLDTRKGKILFLELGVGFNTPGIIKYPFWRMTKNNSRAIYACINFGDAGCPLELKKQSVCIDGDIGEAIEKLVKVAKMKDKEW